MEHKTLSQELEALKLESTINQTTVNRLSSYYNIIYQNSKESVRAINEQINTLINSDNSATYLLNKNLNTLFLSSQEATVKANKTLSKFEKEIIATLGLFQTNLSTIYDDNIAIFESIITEITSSKQRLESAQIGYYKTAYDAQLFYNSPPQVNGNGSEMSAFIEKVITMRSQAGIYEQSYHYEIKRHNEAIVDCNKKYDKMIANLNQNEKSRVYFIKFSIEKYSKIVDELSAILKELIANVNSLFSYNCEEQISELLTSMSGNNTIASKEKQSRIPNAQYVSYKEFSDKSMIDESTFDVDLTSPDSNNTLTEEQCNKIIEKTVADLLEDKEISITLIAQIMEILKTNADMAKRFLDYFLKKKSNVWISFANYNNLVHLSYIIMFISLSNDNIFKERFLLNFTVVFITERVFFLEKKTMNKVYLSALLSKNPFFRTISFWKDIIELKLAKKLEDHIVPLTNMKFPEDETNIFSKLGNKLGLNNNIKKNSLIYKSRIRKCIKSIDALPLQKIPTLDSIATSELIGIIKETIPNLANFNISDDNAIRLIKELEKEYQIPKEQTEFFITYYIVSSYTIRKRLLNKQYDNEDKYKTIKAMKASEKSIKAILMSIDFLTKKDYISLMLLSKSTNKTISMKIYKMVLKDYNLLNKTRLSIYSNILKIPELKKKYDYKKLSTDFSKLDENVIYEIQIDVPRTFISSQFDKTDTQLQMTNILNALCQVNDGIKYCQGMNYIVQFLLEITRDEEMAFYVFLGFFKSTEYPMIYSKDLIKIKIFFYLFKRMISLFQPELFNYFNSTNFEVHSFLAPWFITLFQSVRPSITGTDMPIVLIKVFDDFLSSGWKALIKIGLNILRYYEADLLKMKFEHLLQFLVNSTMTLDFFANKNLEIYDKMIRETKIPKKLLKFIEREFNLDENLKEKEKGKK